jgi:hypothetical protein
VIKLGKKGFMLAETLVVSSVLLITFTFLYVQFFDVLNKYTIYSDYDNIDKLYSIYNIKEFVREDNFDAIINQLNNNIGGNTPYVDLTDCSMFEENEYCTTLFEQLNVKRLIFTNYDLDLFSNWNGINHNFNRNLQTYINTLQANYGDLYDGFYRVIVEFDDGSFSTGRVSGQDVNDISEIWSEWQPLGPTSSVDYLTHDQAYYMYPIGTRSDGYIDLDGVNDKIQIAHDSSLSVNNTDEITLMAWVNPRSYVDHGTVVTKCLEYYFQIHSDGKVATYTYWDNNGAHGDSSYFYSNSVVPLNKWTHIAFTEDNTGFRKIYINGQLDKSGQFESSIFASTYILEIGGEETAGGRLFNGKINDVAIFNRDLSQEEIQAAMNNGLTGSESGLIAYYPLNDGAGNVAADYLNRNHGTVVDGTWGYTYSSNSDILKNLINQKIDQVNIDGTITNVVTGYNNLYEVQFKTNSYRYNDYVLNFDGVDDKVTTSSTGITGNATHSFSIDVFIDSYSTTLREGILNLGPQTSGGHHILLETNDTFNINRWGYGIGVVPSTSVSSYLGKWLNITTTYNNSNREYKIYFNGDLIHSGIQSADYPFALDGTIVLGEGVPGEGLFDGKIRNFALYSDVLTETEIKKIADNFSNLPKDNLAVYYRFDEGIGSNIIDYSGNNHSGTVTGNPAWYFSGMTKKVIDNKVDRQYQYMDSAFSYRYRLLPSDQSLVYLNRVYEYGYTGDYQTFIAPVSGTYKIELWGAQGGDYYTILGGRGGYTSGNINLIKGSTLYIYVGGYPKANNEIGGYNGGGSLTAGQSAYGRAGGGATDVRLNKGDWNDVMGLRSRIMVAGGGGGANNRNYNDTSCGYGQGEGGIGGNLVGGTGTTTGHTYNGCTYGWGVGTGGTQTSGGHYIGYNSSGVVTEDILTAAFGYGGGTATYTAAGTQTGGGGGYYGGGLSGHGGAGGGSSFISGHIGCNAINSSGAHTGQPNHYSGKVFTNTQMKTGNESMPNPRGTGNITGNSGNGYAKITIVSVD